VGPQPAGDDTVVAEPAPPRLDPTPDAESRDDDGPGTGSATQPWSRRLAGWPAQAATSTLLLAVLLHLRYVYLAGDRDHLVLSPMGMRWADPDAFAGDWALSNAPQPHWLFDVVTWVGASTGTLSLIYLLYWVAGLAAFGVATALLARTWTPQSSWVAVVAVTVVAAIAPLYVLGSGAHLFATALPNGLGGCLLYLCAAALLVGRHRLAAVAGVATALAHVQHGVVALVLLLMMAAAVWLLRGRRFDLWLIGAVVADVAIVVFNLKLRPVAGELKDFQEVCGLLIPFHCEATSWTWGYFYGGVALMALALLTVGFVAVGERFRWVIVIVLPFLGLMGGVFADRYNVPVLGLAAQGLNVYRLTIELFQFSIWGLLVVAFAKLTPRQRWIGLVVTLVLASYALKNQFWALDGNPTATTLPANGVQSIPLLLVAGLCLVAAVVVQTVPDLRLDPKRFVPVAVGAGVLVLLVSGVAGNQFRPQPFDPKFFSKPGLVAWGKEVRQVVPPGEQLLVPPSDVWVRMAAERGVVADCKLAPYGGEAWREYRTRIEELITFPECWLAGWPKQTAQQLADSARRYGADYIVVRSDQVTDTTVQAALEAQGWTRVVGERPGAPYRVLKAPWETQ
jgi:hypothetical protein